MTSQRRINGKATPERNPINILLVDDNRPFVDAMARLLSRIDRVAVVGCAGSGCEALVLTQSLHPDLVMMDLAMPKMNGLEATRRIKALSEAPAVVIVTLHDDPEYRAAATDAGADGFIGKSELVNQLPHLIRELFITPNQKEQAGGIWPEAPPGSEVAPL